MATIIIVAEEPALRAQLAQTLGETHHLLELDSLDAARDALEAFTPDLVVTAAALPDGSGLQLCRQVRARHGRRVGLAVVTAVDVEPMGALLAGADDVLTAPLEADDVARLERVLLRARGATRGGVARTAL